MSTGIRSYSPTDRHQAGWVRDVERQLARTRQTFRWNSDDAPITVASAARAKPVEVRVCGAILVTGSTGSVISGAPITWRWTGAGFEVSAIGTITASTDYDVTVELVE